MARPKKTGFTYWPFDVDLFEDDKVIRLKQSYGLDGVCVYIFILCKIYRDRGYFLSWDENSALGVADRLSLKETKVEGIVDFCLTVGLFDKALRLREGVLTSCSIQDRFKEMSTRRGADIDRRYRLSRGVIATETPVIATETPVIATETPVIATETPVIATESTQKKRKGKKEKTTTVVVVKKKDALSFSPPLQQQVEAFVEKEGLKMDVSRFMAYNGMRGWKGVESWEDAARCWASSPKNGAKERGHPKAEAKGVGVIELPPDTGPTLSDDEKMKQRLKGFIEAYAKGQRGFIVEILRTAKRNGNLQRVELEWEE